MNPARRGPTALASSLLAILGLMAVLAAGAQANWLVEGTELTTNETVAVKPHTPWTLKVLAKNLELQCSTVESEGLTLIAKSGTGEGKVKYSKCVTFSPPESGKESKNCKPKEPIIAGGKTLIILHNSENWILDEPGSGSIKFSTIEFSELCALTESADLTGTVVLECGTLLASQWVHLDCKSSSSLRLERPAPETLFSSDSLKFGPNVAIPGGIIALSLAGINATKPWAAEI